MVSLLHVFVGYLRCLLCRLVLVHRWGWQLWFIASATEEDTPQGFWPTVEFKNERDGGGTGGGTGGGERGRC